MALDPFIFWYLHINSTGNAPPSKRNTSRSRRWLNVMWVYHRVSSQLKSWMFLWLHSIWSMPTIGKTRVGWPCHPWQALTPMRYHAIRRWGGGCHMQTGEHVGSLLLGLNFNFSFQMGCRLSPNKTQNALAAVWIWTKHESYSCLEKIHQLMGCSSRSSEGVAFISASVVIMMYFTWFTCKYICTVASGPGGGIRSRAVTRKHLFLVTPVNTKKHPHYPSQNETTVYQPAFSILVFGSRLFLVLNPLPHSGQ